MTSARVIPETMRGPLNEVRDLTDKMREHEQAIKDIADVRRERIQYLRANRVTYREIANAMGVTEQTVFKSLRPILDAERAEREATDPDGVADAS